MDWQERATKEKSLGEVYWKARRVGSTKTNFRMAALVGITFILIASADWYFEFAVFSLGQLKALVNQIAAIGFALTTAILGFLIAGFSIFASITRPTIFAGLAKLDHKDSGLSRLQFIFFNFLLVFIHYLAFLGASMFLKLFLPVAPAMVDLIVQHTGISAMHVWWAGVGMAGLLLSWLTFLMMLLKSFIWNIYQAVLVVIVTGDQIAELENNRAEAPSRDTG